MAPGAHTTNERSIKVEGRFDAFVAQEIRSQVASAVEERPDTLLVDLSDVSFVDSAGLAVLVWARKQMATIDGELVVIRPRLEEAFRVFELTRFDKVFTIRKPS